MTLAPEYADDLVTVYLADHATLAAHLRETGVVCDALCVDAPYSDRVHTKQRHGRREAQPLGGGLWATSRGIPYAGWAAEDVADFCSAWVPIVRGWCVSITDSELYPAWRDAFRDADRYVFAPLPLVQIGMNVRLAGDGPSSWTTWAVVARPAALHKWGTLRGAYVGNPFEDGENTASASRRSLWVGGKPVWLIRALVRDYSRPGDLIVDPCCGAGTLGVAVRYEGRRAILADKDPAAVETTIKRLRGERTKPTRDDFPQTEDQPSLFGKP